MINIILTSSTTICIVVVIIIIIIARLLIIIIGPLERRAPPAPQSAPFRESESDIHPRL